MRITICAVCGKMAFVLAFLSITCFGQQPASSDTARLSAEMSPVAGLGRNVYGSFTGRNALLQAAGISATWLLVGSDADFLVQRYFSQHEQVSAAFLPVALTGALGPVALSGGFYLYGKYGGYPQLFGAGCALIQANTVNFAYNSLLKALTGRPHPDSLMDADMKNQSRTFHFGFARGGIFWGWPSGHSSATMATVSCLAHYYPRKTWLKIAGYSWVAYTVAGVAAVGNGHMHWLSDGVAGACMSYAIGATTGTYFRELQENKKNEEPKLGLHISPVFGEEFCGVQLWRNL